MSTGSSSAGSRILVVEDNANLALALERSLESDGHRVQIVDRGDQVAEVVRGGDIDLVVLDLMLPGLDGFEVLRALREHGVETPVLILSARGEDVDKVQGFRLGADDYVVKPVGLVELLLRVRAILRRTGGVEAPAPGARHTVGELTIDVGARTVHRGTTAIETTPLEFALLVRLLQNRGQAVSREQLLADVWGFPDPNRVRTRTIDTHIATLRAKLESDPTAPRLILTVRKVGYRIDA